MSLQIEPLKDPENEQPIPTAWRPTIVEIVSRLAARDIGLEQPVSHVKPVTERSIATIERNLQVFSSEHGGATLLELPEQTWETSTCIWWSSSWEAIVDLWTAETGFAPPGETGVVVRSGCL